jgi:parallel beta-helix repeat protein
MGRNWAWRGNVVRGNVFRNIKRFAPGYTVNAVYFDDELSGNSVLGNTFINCDVGVLLGGGKDNTVVGNSFVDMSTYAVTLDNRGLNWQAAFCKPGGQLEQSLVKVNYLTNAAYAKYPFILSTMSGNGSCVPSNNVVANNTYCGSFAFLGASTPKQVAAWGSVLSGNQLRCPPTPAPTVLQPSVSPSVSTTPVPTGAPKVPPLFSPMRSSSLSPSLSFSLTPSRSSSVSPTGFPSLSSTRSPSVFPTTLRSLPPTRSPSMSPTAPPSLSPTHLLFNQSAQTFFVEQKAFAFHVKCVLDFGLVVVKFQGICRDIGQL